MDHCRAYDQIIALAKARAAPDGYTERHHVVPKSMGGTNAKANIVRLTGREHFVAHRLLAKIHPTTGMVHAVYLMACIDRRHGRYRVTARTYETLRIAHAARTSRNETLREINSRLHRKPQSEQHKKNRVDARKANGQPWHSPETGKKIAVSNAKPRGPAGRKTPQQMIAHMAGVAHRKENGSYIISDATRQRMTEANRRPRNKRGLTEVEMERLRIHANTEVVCPHCGKCGHRIVMGRWHFDKCKERKT